MKFKVSRENQNTENLVSTTLIQISFQYLSSDSIGVDIYKADF